MLTDRVGEVLVKLNKQDERIDILEDADGEKSRKKITWLATTVGALVIGAIFGIIMKGGMMIEFIQANLASIIVVAIAIIGLLVLYKVR